MPKEGNKLQWSKWSQIVLLFDGLTFFPVRGDTPICCQILYLSVWCFHHNRTHCRDHIVYFNKCFEVILRRYFDMKKKISFRRYSHCIRRKHSNYQTTCNCITSHFTSKDKISLVRSQCQDNYFCTETIYDLSSWCWGAWNRNTPQTSLLNV